MKQKVLIPTLITVAVIGFLYLYFQIPIETSPSDIINNVKNYFKELASPNSDLDDLIDYEEDSEAQAGGGGISGGEGGGGASSGTSSQEIVCSMQPQPYALRKPQTEETCNTYEGQVCTDKTVDCNIEVHNLQSTDSGTFDLKISIVKEDYEEVFVTTQSKTISPNSFEVYSAQNSFQAEDARQELRCFFNTISVPEYEICS